MRFGRRSSPKQGTPEVPEESLGADTGDVGVAGDAVQDDAAMDVAPAAAAGSSGGGPFDESEAPEGVERVDLGSLLIAPSPGRELRLQVDQATGAVQSVLVGGSDGAVELRAFAASRGGDLWSEIRPRIAADLAKAGGTATERVGPWGVELECRQPVQSAGAKGGMQVTRVVGVNGPRWFVRATFLGRPAAEPDACPDWEEVLAAVVVRRGSHAMPPGDPLELVLPPDARPAP